MARTNKYTQRRKGIVTPYGQWLYPGKVTTIPDNKITMQGVPYPVLGVSDKGDAKMMLPGMDYLFKGNEVTEYPVMQQGGFGRKRVEKNGMEYLPNTDAYTGVVQKQTQHGLGVSRRYDAPVYQYYDNGNPVGESWKGASGFQNDIVKDYESEPVVPFRRKYSNYDPNSLTYFKDLATGETPFKPYISPETQALWDYQLPITENPSQTRMGYSMPRYIPSVNTTHYIENTNGIVNGWYNDNRENAKIEDYIDELRPWMEKYEGKRNNAYKLDGENWYTIGIGHAHVPQGTMWNDDEINKTFKNDILSRANAINRYYKEKGVTLSPRTLAGLAAYSFSGYGSNVMQRSPKLTEHIVNNRFDNIREEMDWGEREHPRLKDKHDELYKWLTEGSFQTGGKIHIKEKNRGKFTEAAQRAGKSVQAYAAQILANKDNYSPTLVKRANFARNSAKFKHQEGGTYLDTFFSNADKQNNMYDRNAMTQLDNYFTKRGLTENQKKALLYNILIESGGAKTLGAHGNGYYGLVGWSGDRFNYIKDKSLLGQAEYLVDNLRNCDGKYSWNHGGDGSGYNSWIDAKTTFWNPDADFDTVNNALIYGYIRPADKIGRKNNAANYYQTGGIGKYLEGNYVQPQSVNSVLQSWNDMLAKGLSKGDNIANLVGTGLQAAATAGGAVATQFGKDFTRDIMAGQRNKQTSAIASNFEVQENPNAAPLYWPSEQNNNIQPLNNGYYGFPVIDNGESPYKSNQRVNIRKNSSSGDYWNNYFNQNNEFDRMDYLKFATGGSSSTPAEIERGEIVSTSTGNSIANDRMNYHELYSNDNEQTGNIVNLTNNMQKDVVRNPQLSPVSKRVNKYTAMRRNGKTFIFPSTVGINGEILEPKNGVDYPLAAFINGIKAQSGGIMVRSGDRKFYKSNPTLRKYYKEAQKMREDEQARNYNSFKHIDDVMTFKSSEDDWTHEPIMRGFHVVIPNQQMKPQQWARAAYNNYMQGDYGLDEIKYEDRKDRKYQRALNKEIARNDWQRAADRLAGETDAFSNRVAQRPDYKGLGYFMLGLEGLAGGLAMAPALGAAGSAFLSDMLSPSGAALLKSLALGTVAGEAIENAPRIWSGKRYSEQIADIVFPEQYRKDNPNLTEFVASMMNPGYYLGFSPMAKGLQYTGKLLPKISSNIEKLNIIRKNGKFRIGFERPSDIQYGIYTRVNPYAESSIPVSQITAENAASITPEQWTAAQDAAVARGDMAEAQRLRDLHFKIHANPVLTQEGNMRLTHATKNKFNIFDLDKAGSGSGNISNTEGVIHLSPYDESALDVFKTKSLEERNKYNLMHLYVHNPNPVNVDLKDFIKTFNNKNAFKKLRDAGDGIIARGESPYKIYNDKVAEYEAKKAAGKLSMWDIKPESPTDFMEESVVDGYTINKPEYIKSADAVTYDDNGVRIPLGLRDNFKMNDIRFSWLAPFMGLGTLGALYNNTNK